jgi:hypothetical protein
VEAWRGVLSYTIKKWTYVNEIICFLLKWSFSIMTLIYYSFRSSVFYSTGCIKSYGADDNFGVTYDFADQIAVSTCTALLSMESHVYAVRRNCSKLAASCEDTCKLVGYLSYKLFNCSNLAVSCEDTCKNLGYFDILFTSGFLKWIVQRPFLNCSLPN